MTDMSSEQQAGKRYPEGIISERPTAVEAARAEIETLTRKLNEMAGRKEHNRAHRAAAGLPTSSNDGRNLADLRSEALRISLEEDDLKSWLAAARERLAAAEHAEVIAEDVERAKRRLALAGAFRRVGGLLDAALTAQRCHAWLAVAAELRLTRLSSEAYGVGPSEQQVKVLGLQALLTMLKETPWSQEFSPIAPKDRRSFQSLSDGWAAMAERSAREFLTGAGVALEPAEAAE
jgi:hypothetical protein